MPRHQMPRQKVRQLKRINQRERQQDEWGRVRSEEDRDPEARRVHMFMWVTAAVLALITAGPVVVWKLTQRPPTTSERNAALESLDLNLRMWQMLTGTAPPAVQPVTAKAPQQMVIGYDGLNYRSAPTLEPETVQGQFHFGDHIKVVGLTRGSNPTGKGVVPWYWLDNGRYVWAKYVYPPGKLPQCVLPMASGSSWRLSSGYGWRVHPTKHTRKMHWGYDFAAEAGTPILAVTAGTVIASGKMDPGGFGAAVKVKDLQGRIWVYGHVNWRSVLPPGTKVQPTTRLATVGHDVGDSTGDHLHLALDANGVGYTGHDPYVDSRPILAKCGVNLPK